MPKEVLAWLNSNRNYLEGLALLQQFGASKFILDMLSSGPGPFNTPKLLKELQKIPAPVATDQPVPGATIIPVLDDKLKDGQYLIDSKDASDQLARAIGLPTHGISAKAQHDLEKSLRIKKQIKDLLKEITFLRGKLAVLPEGEELYQCSRDVVLKDLKKQELWQHLHYFEQNGKWFDEQPENQIAEFDVNDPGQLEQKIKNLMSSRSKTTNELKRPWPPAKTAHLQRRQDELTKEINYYRSLRKDV